MSWIEQAKRVALTRVATELGIELARRNNLAWCPSCQSRKHGSANTYRRRDGVERWKCHRCHAGGDAIDLAAVVLTGEALSRGRSAASAQVQAWFAARGWCRSDNDQPTRPAKPTCPPPGREIEPVKPPPPQEEVLGLLRCCRPISRDGVVRGWVEQRLGRKIADAVDGRGIIGALQHTVVPTWAWMGNPARPWPELEYRAIFPLYDRLGAIRSVRARRVVPGDGPSAVPPRGHGCASLVMANRLAREVLEHGRAPAWWDAASRFQLVIAEGETDFLAWSAAALLNDFPDAPSAVIGIYSGSWSDIGDGSMIAERFPDRTDVLIATDHDPAGERYAKKIARSFIGRARIRRWFPPGVS